MQTDFRLHSQKHSEMSLYFRLQSTQDSPKKLVVLVHGYGGEMNAWNTLIHNLHAPHTCFLLVDLLGHGQSSRPAYPFDDEFETNEQILTHAIKRTQQQLDITHTTVVGHCFGGYVSTLLCAHNQKRVDHLVLVRSGYTAPPLLNLLTNPVGAALFDLAARTLPATSHANTIDYAKRIGSHDLDITRIWSDMRSTGLKYYFSHAKQLGYFNLIQDIAHIRIPTTIIGGGFDTVFPPDYTRRFAALFPNHKLIFIEKGNHVTPISNPILLAQTLQAILQT